MVLCGGKKMKYIFNIHTSSSTEQHFKNAMKRVFCCLSFHSAQELMKLKKKQRKNILFSLFQLSLYIRKKEAFQSGKNIRTKWNENRYENEHMSNDILLIPFRFEQPSILLSHSKL